MDSMRSAAVLLLMILVPVVNPVLGFHAPAKLTQTRSTSNRSVSRYHHAAVLSPRASSVAASSDTSGSSMDVSSSTFPTKGGKARTSPFDEEDSGVRDGGEKDELKGRAPLVDSALLRFLSAQKTATCLDNPNNLADVTGKEVITNEERDGGGGPASGVGAQTNEEGEQNLRADVEANPMPMTTGESYVDSSWLGQYNEHSVAQQLIAIGSDESQAYKAGRAVQRHILARTMRRRIRKFLRERDTMWAEANFGVVDKERAPKVSADFSPSVELELDSYRGEEVIKLLRDAGLTGKDIAVIFAHTPSVAAMKVNKQRASVGAVAGSGETLEETLELSFEVLLRKNLKLRKYDARKVIRNCPGLLTKRGSQSADQVVKLMSSLGVSTSSLARNKVSLPILLSRTPSAIFRLVAFLSSDIIQMSLSSIGPFIRRKEARLLLDAVAPIGDAQDSEVGIANKNRISGAGKLGTDMSWTDRLLGGGLQERRDRVNEDYRTMASTARFLRDEVGIMDVGAVVSACPGVLLLNTTQIASVVDYLIDDIGILDDDISRVVEMYPALLTMDVSAIQKVVDFLISLEVAEDSLGVIFRAFPSLLTLDVKADMMPVVEFLRSIGVTNIGRFVTRLPPILGYSVQEDLIPKWDYLTQVCQYGQFEVVRFPAYFSYPLERIIKTRYEYLREEKKVPVKLVGVDDVVRYGDLDFAQKIAGDGDGGAAFAAYVQSRSSIAKQMKKGNIRRRKRGAGNARSRAAQGRIERSRRSSNR